MSGKIVSKYASIADMTSVLQTIEAQRNGLNLVTFTEMDSTLAPKIAKGSVVEVAGALFQFDEDTTISGTATSGNNYILLTPSGTGEDQILSASYSSTLPAFDTEKNGYYSGLTRAVGYVFLYASSYLRKSVVANKNEWLENSVVRNDSNTGNNLVVGNNVSIGNSLTVETSVTLGGIVQPKFNVIEAFGSTFLAGINRGEFFAGGSVVSLNFYRPDNDLWEMSNEYGSISDSGVVNIFHATPTTTYKMIISNI